MNQNAIAEWLKLSDDSKRNIFNETAARIGLPRASAVEKDWWVVRTLEILFQTEIKDCIVFKGGTSLSKGWGLIDRLSEDIDISIDRNFFGFTEPDHEMSQQKVKKLRRASYAYVNEKLLSQIENIFLSLGLKIKITIVPTENHDKDPVGIEVFYQALTDPDPYFPDRVLIEIGSRSLIEPYTKKSINSYVGQVFSGRGFADLSMDFPTVNPERTFLEKIFLLHELFQKEYDEEKHRRKSRHFYDLQKLMNTEFATKAWGDPELYKTIVSHRKFLNKEKGIDYDKHAPEYISIIPSEDVLGSWEKDYHEMRESMFYGESLSFGELMIQIKALNEKINQHKI